MQQENQQLCVAVRRVAVLSPDDFFEMTSHVNTIMPHPTNDTHQLRDKTTAESLQHASVPELTTNNTASIS